MYCDDPEDHAPSRSAISHPACAANNEYVAFIRHGRVYFQEVRYLNHAPQCLHHDSLAGHDLVLLAISALSPTKLAVAGGHDVYIFDLRRGTLTVTLSISSWKITSIDWSPTRQDIVAAGCIDGTVSVWHLTRPRHRLLFEACGQGACRIIKFDPYHDSLLAISDGQSICLWNINSGYHRRIWSCEVRCDCDVVFAWSTSQSRRHLTILHDERVVAFDLPEIDSGRGDDELFDAEHDWNSDSTSSLSSDDPTEDGTFHDIALDVSPMTVQQIGERGILCLVEDGKEGNEASLYSTTYHENNVSKAWSERLWSVHLLEPATNIQIVEIEGRLSVLSVHEDGAKQYEIPEHVLRSVGWDAGKSKRDLHRPTAEPNLQEGQPEDVKVVTSSQMPLSWDMASMSPVAIASPGRRCTSLAESSARLQKNGLSHWNDDVQSSNVTHQQSSRDLLEPATPPPKSMTSSLELPPNTSERGSSMPFLSPSIPSKEPSPNGDPARDDGLELSPLPRASFDSTFPSTTSDSDDSDDETFVDGMNGSSTFMPGGIHVPLPKACGALFGNTGELLTFFPTKAIRLSIGSEVSLEDPHENAESDRKVAKLFPLFGNFEDDASAELYDTDDSASTASDSDSDVWSKAHRSKPDFYVTPTSFQSHPYWKSKASPTKPSILQQPQDKLAISVQSLAGVTSLYPASRILAERYRVIFGAIENVAEICVHNASIAASAGLSDVQYIWRLFGLILEGEETLLLFSQDSSKSDIVGLARTACAFKKSRATLGLRAQTKHDARSRYRGWISHPFGASWMIRLCFQWAEFRADMQLLACMAVILLQVHRDILAEDDRSTALSRLSSHSSVNFASNSHLAPARTPPSRPIPILRASTESSIAVYDVHVKQHRGSNTSSRNASQPTTPYLESISSTPPMPSLPLSRQESRMSTFGSASPELHRSSFGAAARHYAQSIADKFPSYGSSPPLKKTGRSPSAANELSSSLPSGSWSKSVSFASTTDTARNSQLSRSYDEQNKDGGYDSDKTIDDGSMPTTPKGPLDEVFTTFKNEEMFADRLGGAAGPDILPQDLLANCRAWCQYYAEQLRSWGLLLQGSEMERFGGGQPSNTKPTSITDSADVAVVPVPIKDRLSVHKCAICIASSERLLQICPSCLHCTHLSCLEEYINDLDDDGFSCPTGCGCSCSELAYTDTAWTAEEDARTLKKTPSYNDARSWQYW